MSTHKRIKGGQAVPALLFYSLFWRKYSALCFIRKTDRQVPHAAVNVDAVPAAAVNAVVSHRLAIQSRAAHTFVKFDLVVLSASQEHQFRITDAIIQGAVSGEPAGQIPAYPRPWTGADHAVLRRR